MVVFENNVISTSIFESLIYEYRRAAHDHPAGQENTQLSVSGEPSKIITEHNVEILPIKLVQGKCNTEICVEKIICVDKDIDFSVDSCTKPDLSRETRIRLDQIYKDALASLYLSSPNKIAGPNPCAAKNPRNPCGAKKL